MNFLMYWQYTDMVSKSLFFILIALSVASWVVGILRIRQSAKLSQTIAEHLDDHMASHHGAWQHLTFEQQKTNSEQLLLKYIAQFRFDSEKGLIVLGTTAAIAPFIGLFGTVWGIFHALHKVGQTGQAGLSQVAGPVGEALIMTGLGLAVAIPAVVFYNIAVRLNKVAMHKAHSVAYDVLAKIAV